VEQHSVSAQQAGDLLAIRELIDAYARCADRREADRQKALFTEDTHFLVYLNGQGAEATEDLHGREALTPVFDALNQYEVTMHFNGQSTVRLDELIATAESYCIAHHVFTADEERKIMIAYLRYDDTLRRERGAWRFAERKLYLDFSDTRAFGG
jgi:SnoaL-like domain